MGRTPLSAENKIVILKPPSVTKSIKPTSSKEKFSKCADFFRRSKRLQKLDVEPIVEDLTERQSENEDNPPAQERKYMLGSPSKKSYGEKLNHLADFDKAPGYAIKASSLINALTKEDTNWNQRIKFAIFQMKAERKRQGESLGDFAGKLLSKDFSRKRHTAP